MSKIEKALTRAREERQTGAPVTRPPAPDQTAPASPVGTEMVAVPSGRRAEDETDLRLRATQAIALMREATLRSHTELAERRIIVPSAHESATVRAFREIRTKLLQKTGGKNCVVMVTSVGHQDGTTFVVANLGVAFAFDAGKTALLVDCNLRTPALQQLLPATDAIGLTDYLAGGAPDIRDVIHPVGIERLRVVPVGSKRDLPAEYFTSTKMREFIDSLKRRYRERFIVLDAPPMSESADTQILSELCDYVVLVVPYAKVTVSQLEHCLRTIDRAKLLGVVFNNEPVLPALGWRDWLPQPVIRLIMPLHRWWRGLHKGARGA
jgi:capsular exopolysaccharide synthesis family protein